MKLNVLSPQHPFWLAGFRPFFTFAMLLGILMPALWGFVFSGKLVLLADMNPLQWHAHEMLFGFAGSVLIGFLLTASKNWVKVRGIHGAGLMVLVALWIFERIFIYYTHEFGPLLKHLGLSIFFTASGLYIITTLIRHRKNDSFNDNYFLIILLSLILLAKNLLLSEAYQQYGVNMTVGLFRLAFVVMFERTITQFMKNTEDLILYRNKFLDFFIKASVLLSVFSSLFPQLIAAGVLTVAGLLLLLRWILWRPDAGFKKFGNATMYFGYFGLILHFIFAALQTLEIWSSGTIALHLFTILCLGIVVPSMLIRISQGHTGRIPQFVYSDKIAIYLIFASAVFRLLAPLINSSGYTMWILIAGLLWSAAYLILSFRLIPFLFQARIDGKEH